MSLRRAHAEIDALSRAIAARRAPPRALRRGPVVLAAVLVVAALSATGMALFARAPRAAAAVAAPSSPPPEPLVAAQIVTTPRGPLTIIRDDANVEDIVLLARRPNLPAELIRQDAREGTPRWRVPVPGLPSPTSAASELRLVGRRIVITDGRQLWAFRPEDGGAVGRWRAGATVQTLCSVPGNVGQLAVTTHSTKIEVIDLATGAIAVSPTLGPDVCSDDRVGPRPVLGKLIHDPDATFEDGEARVTVGWPSQGDNPVGVFVDARSGRVLAERGLVLPDDVGAARGFAFAFAAGRLVVAYRLGQNRGFRLVAFDARVGALAWSAGIDAFEPSIVGLQGTGNRLYLSLENRILVVDAATGAVLASLGDRQVSL